MCGLAGAMSSTLSKHETDIFKDLLNVASLRGSTGSGVAVLQNSYLNPRKIQVLKTKHISGALAYSSELDELLKPRVSAVIGHARLPTKGGLDEDAVHPHRFGHIVGVHNGTMHRVAGQDVKEKSDSAMLFEAIAAVGIEEAIKESAGAYALVWVDEKEGTLNFLKNAWRPLYFKNIGWGDKNINTLYWSSEAEMLDFVVGRLHKGNNTWDTFLPNDTLFKYPLDVKHIIKPVEVKRDVRPTPPKTQPSSGHKAGAGANWRGQHPRDWDAEDMPPFIQNGMRHVWDPIKEEYVVERPFDIQRGDGTTRGGFSQDELPWAGVNRVLRLPAPDVQKMTKSERKKYEKSLKLEEKAAHQRLAAFRKANEVEQRRRERAQKEKDLRPALAELVDSDDSPAVCRDRSGVAPDFGGRDTYLGGHKRELRAVGVECCWCGTRAEAGDNVFLTTNDVGCRDFVCYDCGTSTAAAAAYTSDARVATIVN